MIKYAILGLLSWEALTGYDLKQIFQSSTTMYWSGSSNQIYRTLGKLYEDDLVTRWIENQQTGPSRKIYSITDKGKQAFREWLIQPPQPPAFKHPFMIQLIWGDTLSADELEDLLIDYTNKVEMKLQIIRKEIQHTKRPPHSDREALLWKYIDDHWIQLYEQELTWIQALQAELENLE